MPGERQKSEYEEVMRKLPDDRVGGPFKPGFGLSGAVRIPFRFAEQEVNMLRHDYVPVNLKAETATHSLQS